MNIQVVMYLLNSILTYFIIFFINIFYNLVRIYFNCKTSNNNIPDIWANLRYHIIYTQ